MSVLGRLVASMGVLLGLGCSAEVPSNLGSEPRAEVAAATGRPQSAPSSCADRNIAPDELCTPEQERQVEPFEYAPDTCGDGVVQSEAEDCELHPNGSPRGGEPWDARTCNRATCRRTTYVPCDVDVPNVCGDPDDGIACLEGICTRVTCLPATPQRDCARPCPALPGRAPESVGGWCVLECSRDEPCPTGLLCHLNRGRCVGPSYVRYARCGDANEREWGGCDL